MPFSYVSVEAESLDGNSYPVQVYSDISAGGSWPITLTTGLSLTSICRVGIWEQVEPREVE